MPTFRPPTDNYMELGIEPTEFANKEIRMAYNLFRHYDPEPRGRNVFLLANGTYTEDEPNDTTLIAKTYFGGSNNQITDAEATSLTAAGYGAYIT